MIKISCLMCLLLVPGWGARSLYIHIASAVSPYCGKCRGAGENRKSAPSANHTREKFAVNVLHLWLSNSKSIHRHGPCAGDFWMQQRSKEQPQTQPFTALSSYPHTLPHHPTHHTGRPTRYGWEGCVGGRGVWCMLSGGSGAWVGGVYG